MGWGGVVGGGVRVGGRVLNVVVVVGVEMDMRVCVHVCLCMYA